VPTDAPTSGGDEDTGEGSPVDVEPVDDPDARLALPTAPKTSPPPADGEPPAAPTDAVPTTPAPPGQDPVAAEPPPVPTEQPALAEAPDTDPRSERGPDGAGSDRAGKQGHAPESDAKTPLPSTGPAPTEPTQPPASAVPLQSQTTPAPVPAAPPAEPVVVVQANAPAESAPPPLSTNDRAYMVRPGDSLWSIARRLLGSDASPARIAREVNRLWELNKDRIGTGDPDLLKVGTRLTLR
jgi:nucleoid-associated protein YgaU